MDEAILREVREETGYHSYEAPIKLGEFFVNPATQTNKVITYLIKDAVKLYEQDLDEYEEIDVYLFDYKELDVDEAIKQNRIKTQLFTVNAFYMAKDYY
ncbi:NUDIX hydrolase [Metabacillus malikii]|uniref:8-oxo-dGTP pyrophosphatase MutT (NUDIX family) n=1 Tax=Metabacillus malikii TaxID=1504265 RepID=A0ABT9ZB26_9BACI|nr:NUDIX domain-containing protein [Metabacillus malikii]MDQ0229026.1 8-oxo-dGTP pyrophosphatase MutT (NUDIX family) [Metabacillus malikii]